MKVLWVLGAYRRYACHSRLRWTTCSGSGTLTCWVFMRSDPTGVPQDEATAVLVGRRRHIGYPTAADVLAPHVSWATSTATGTVYDGLHRAGIIREGPCGWPYRRQGRSRNAALQRRGGLARSSPAVARRKAVRRQDGPSTPSTVTSPTTPPPPAGGCRSCSPRPTTTRAASTAAGPQLKGGGQGHHARNQAAAWCPE